MRRISIYLLMLFSTLEAVQGQESPPMLPPGPLVQLRAPNPGQWTIVNTIANPHSNSGNAEGGATKTTSSYQYTKTGNILHVTYTDSQERVWQIWNIGKTHAFIWADGKSVGFGVPPSPGTSEPLYIDLNQTDFPDFTWLTKANFVDTEDINGMQCLVFQDTLNFNGIQEVCKAMVDLKTRLPVRFEGPAGNSDYTYTKNPPSSQSMPNSIQTAITQQEKKEQLLARIPGPAF